MFKSLIVVQRDTRDVFSILFEVPDDNFDLLAAAKAAAMDFCKTPEGRDVFDGDSFGWYDFMTNVPNEFCEKHGFKMVKTVGSDEIVDWDESLVYEDDLEDENDDWDEEDGDKGDVYKV